MNNLTFSNYQVLAKTTAIYPNVGNNPYYGALGLAGEAGEVADKIKKIMRDKEGKIDKETLDGIKKELGDVLWYVATLSSELSLDMGEIAQENLEKCQRRKTEGKIQGSGDNR